MQTKQGRGERCTTTCPFGENPIWAYHTSHTKAAQASPVLRTTKRFSKRVDFRPRGYNSRQEVCPHLLPTPSHLQVSVGLLYDDAGGDEGENMR